MKNIILFLVYGFFSILPIVLAHTIGEPKTGVWVPFAWAGEAFVIGVVYGTRVYKKS